MGLIWGHTSWLSLYGLSIAPNNILIQSLLTSFFLSDSQVITDVPSVTMKGSRKHLFLLESQLAWVLAQSEWIIQAVVVLLTSPKWRLRGPSYKPGRWSRNSSTLLLDMCWVASPSEKFGWWVRVRELLMSTLSPYLVSHTEDVDLIISNGLQLCFSDWVQSTVTSKFHLIY